MEEVLEKKKQIRHINSDFVAQREGLDTSRKELVRVKMVLNRHYRKIPEEVKSDVKASIGSKFDRYTKAPLRGITDEEVAILMPKILKIKNTNEKFDQMVNEYFADLTIDVPHPEGALLNITTKKTEFEFNGEMVTYDLPESPPDYIKYKQCLADRSVAVTIEEKRNLGQFDFYLEDPREEKRKKLDRVTDIRKIEQPYNELIAIDAEGKLQKEIKAKQVLVLLNVNPYWLSDDDIILELDRLKGEAIEAYDSGVPLDRIPFYQTVNDPDLVAKATVKEFVNYGILEVVGDSYVDAKEPSIVLGGSLNQAVEFLKDPKNQEYKMKYKNALQEKRK